MTDRATAQIPLEIDRVESSRPAAGTIELRLAGRWLDPAGAEEEELLVVQVEGRRHRFPATRESQARGSENWSASFTLPAWAEPRHAGQAALWLGDAVIPVPPTGESSGPGPDSALGRAVPSEPGVAEEPHAAGPEPVGLESVAAETAPRFGGAGAAETPRSGPLADLLLKETVAALHAELERRTAELARIRGTLADAQSDLESRGAMQAALEATHTELREQLERLSRAVERDRTELERRAAELEHARAEMGAELDSLRERHAAEIATLRDQLARAQVGEDRAAGEVGRLREALAAATVARDGAVGESAGLRAELTRLGTELAVTRERVHAESGDLGEAQRLLAEARALTDELSGAPPG